MYDKLEATMKEIRAVLRLTIGPLHYEFQSQDAWGEETLGRLQAQVVCVDYAGRPQRVIHLADLNMTVEENQQINKDWLPDRFAALLPEDSPRQGWQLNGDETGYLTFWHQASSHALWIFGAIPVQFQAPFQLPWSLLLEDIIARGGGVLHGGLITKDGKSLIITAPPGGGKTTAIARLPSDWQVLADDACLVWPGDGNSFLASPLPTWSVLLGRGKALPAIGCWQIETSVNVSGLILLQKCGSDRMTPLPFMQTIPAIYQALSEHPQVVKNCESHRARLFEVAYNLALAASAWQMEISLDGRFWEILQAGVIKAPIKPVGKESLNSG